MACKKCGRKGSSSSGSRVAKVTTSKGKKMVIGKDGKTYILKK